MYHPCLCFCPYLLLKNDARYISSLEIFNWFLNFVVGKIENCSQSLLKVKVTVRVTLIHTSAYNEILIPKAYVYHCFQPLFSLLFLKI